ncbi:TetR/AcrR family transcriptional regulator [Nocardioides sp. Iso805N]|uniref:TetR/AcrR family transcriptional regulator n=1 Tax=Nocardioides sp. Iso805N TaxID=1283287 RepID=UPI00036E4006|nr:TetR/AcrR family transcriptional regulator [Nocardioides sp. Iso805N]
MTTQASDRADQAGKGVLGEQSEASRTRILRAAAQIAAECGYEGTTISKVTKRSGLPVSSVYWFFRDKDHLLAEVVRHSFDEWIAVQPTWDRPRPGARSIGEALRTILSRSTASLASAPDFLRIGHMLLLEKRAEEPAGRGIFMQARRDVEKALTAWFGVFLAGDARAERSDLPRDLARIVIAATDGLFLAHQIDQAGDPRDFVDMVVTIVEAAVEVV